MRNKFLSIGSIITAVLASLCCIGTLLLVGFGIGSVAFFSRFDAYRPYFIGLAAVLLIPAFYLAYKKREIKCEDGTCKIESDGKWNKILVWFAFVVIAGFISFPYFNFNSNNSSITKSYATIKTVNLQIGNMDCKACAFGLQAKLKRENGVKDAKIVFEEGKGTVTYDTRIITKEGISSLLTKEGYPTKVLMNPNE